MGQPIDTDANSQDSASEDILTSVRRLVGQASEPALSDDPTSSTAGEPARQVMSDALSEGPYKLTQDLRIIPGLEEPPQGMSYEPQEKVDALSAKLAALEAASGDLPHLVASDALAFSPEAEAPPNAEASEQASETADASTPPQEPAVVHAFTPDDGSAEEIETPQAPESTPSDADAPSDAPSAPAATSTEALPTETSVGDLDVLDEDALRDLIGEMVREELRGELGERVTRNVRKLVRREISRALASEKL